MIPIIPTIPIFPTIPKIGNAGIIGFAGIIGNIIGIAGISRILDNGLDGTENITPFADAGTKHGREVVHYIMYISFSCDVLSIFL